MDNRLKGGRTSDESESGSTSTLTSPLFAMSSLCFRTWHPKYVEDKNKIPTYKLRSLRLLLNLAATFNPEKFVRLEVVEDGGEVAVIQRQNGLRAVCILGLSG